MMNMDPGTDSSYIVHPSTACDTLGTSETIVSHAASNLHRNMVIAEIPLFVVEQPAPDGDARKVLATAPRRLPVAGVRRSS
jgi:hypothetical protein